jgi:glucosamine-6-phosphate deaminase
VEVRVVNPADLATAGAAAVADALAAAGRPDATLMPALGTSALPVYAAMGRRPTLRLVQLDEYLGLGPDDPRSLFGWLLRDVAAPLGIGDAGIVRLDGRARDAGAACRAYDAAVAAAGGIDVAVLGLGPNGHLGFNEPPSDRAAPTRAVELSPASLASNLRYWPGVEVPAAALTAGMSTILAARFVLLVVRGPGKRGILRTMLEGPVGPDVPATYLREHPNALLIADTAAWPYDGAAA